MQNWMIRESDLDNDQLKVLQATLDKSCIITGCAGSGKSILALLKAQRIQNERSDNYQIIVYTKALCSYMNSGRNELGLTGPFYYQWKWNKSEADYTIVDEIQDFTKEEIQDFINATGKNFFFFGDSAQSVYKNYKDTMEVKNIVSLFPTNERPRYFELYRNYRLPVQVAKFVQHIGNNLPPFDENIYQKNGGRGSIPRVLKYGNQQEQIEAIKRIIGDRLTNVAILLPDNSMVKHISDELNKLNINHEVKYREMYTLNFNTQNPKVMTYHSAKGLQFETVFIPILEYFSEQNIGRNALYVAMTRTYKQLYLMYSGNLPDILKSIPENLYTKNETEKTEEI